MALTQTQIAAQMIQQLRRLDPSVSAEVGTPERKIIDTVAQSITDAQIDLNALAAGFDIDSKFGDTLERFLVLFGFARQAATYAEGYVRFSRNVAALTDIVIPTNTQVQTGTGTVVQFYTTVSATLAAGSTQTAPIPVRAVSPGAVGNVAADQITVMSGSSILGITSVTNETATAGGIDRETDDELKVRFKNTVFRNLAGTRDQFLALAVASQFTLKANVVGPESTWREYIQVPPVDDASSYDYYSDGGPESGNGASGEYTTAPVTLRYAKKVWPTLPPFVVSSDASTLQTFYRRDVDYRFAPVGVVKGDANRIGTAALNYISNGDLAPTVTFTNVYTGAVDTIQAIRPSDVLLLEFRYLSAASRNDIDRNITNCVDVYVDGTNEQQATAVLPAPTVAQSFQDNPSSPFHIENYRRYGDVTRRPLAGNVLMPLLWEPISSIPDQIVVGDNTYLNGTHYWQVQDVSPLAGSVYARDGIEWSMVTKGNSSGTKRFITEWTAGNAQPIVVDGYTFDQNIVDLQNALEANRQVTTDVLAHRARKRYFKFDLTVMYVNGSGISEVNQRIRDTIDTFLSAQYFGQVIQLSDILQVVHGVDGVDNARWSSDFPNGADLARVYEVNSSGSPLLNLTVDTVAPGGTSPNIQRLYITGQPATTLGATPSTFKLSHNGNITSSITYSTSPTTMATNIKNALDPLASIATVTVVEDNRLPSVNPIRSFTITHSDNTAIASYLINTNALRGGPTVIYNDYNVGDDEIAALPLSTYSTPFFGGSITQLPFDTLPGLIIRQRAQNTWTRA